MAIWRMIFVAGLVLLPAAVAIGAEPRVEIEVCTTPDFSITGARDWSTMLGELGLASVRIRGGKPGDEPTIKEGGTEEARTYRVIGILTGGGKLVVPGGSFTLSDKGRIAAWIEKLKSGGNEAITTRPAAFGLLPRELVAVHEGLAKPVGFSTKGKLPLEVSKQIARGLEYKFVSDTAVQQALAAKEPVSDELIGLSSGTALAAVLRPLGLVMFPEKSGREIKLRIADSRAAKEHWPVGWPPKGNPRETLPELFKFLNVEITDTPLGDALPAIAERVKAPLLFDYNGLARKEIDLATTKVSVPKQNTFYSKALNLVLGPSGLKSEIRVDEANRPFLWVSPAVQ